MKTCILLLMAVGPAFPQAGVVDYVMSVKNKPELDPRNYVFTRTSGAGGSSGSMAAGSGRTATLTPCPLGLTSDSINHSYFRVSPTGGGTGAAETPLITNLSTSGSNCTITFDLANTHTGSWVISNNGDGLQEALVAAYDSNARRAVRLGSGYFGYYRTWKPVWVPPYAKILGGGPSLSIIQSQVAGAGILDATGTENTFDGFTLSNLGNAQGTSGNFGVRLGTASVSNSYSNFHNVTFNYLYQPILSINASQIKVSDCNLYDMTYTGILLANPLGPDAVGAQIVNNQFFTDATGTAEAFIYISSTSSILISNNNMIGTDASGPSANINYCVENVATTSGGWLNITGNKCEKTALEAYKVDGTWTQITITGNTVANSGGVNNWNGIQVSGTGTQYRNAITGNVIQCGGTGNNGIYLAGTVQSTIITPNEIIDCNFGINANGSPTNVLIGQNNINNSGTSPAYIVSNGVLIDMPGPFTYAQMTSGGSGINNAADGSRVYCSNCNSTCTAGGSGGRWCEKNSGSWTH